VAVYNTEVTDAAPPRTSRGCETMFDLKTLGLPVLIFLLVASPLSAADKPNIIFILADDMGWTGLGCQGSKYYETPHIDRLAAEGMRFTAGYTCGPNCQPTRAALMSGQYGPRTGVYTVGHIDRFNWRSRRLRPVDNVQQLPLDRTTIAEALKKAGYATGMFGKWHLGNDGDYHPGRRGFDEAVVSAGRHFNFNTIPPVEHAEDAYLADFLTDKAVDFIRRHKDEPFFLYVPHFGVHSPFQAKQELIDHFSGKMPVAGQGDATYAAMTASVDQSVGRIVALVNELELADNTLIIFSSDNGGVGGYQREGVDARSITDNAPLRGGKGMLYEGGIRVPYIFYWKGVIAAGSVCDVPITSVDLFPTLLEVAGAAKPKQALDGTSYHKLLTSGGAGTLDREAIYWHFPGYLGSGNDTWRTTPVGVVRRGKWKLLEFFEDGHREFYNLRDDPGETNDLANSEPELVNRLHQSLIAWRNDVGAKMPTARSPDPTATQKTKQKRRRQRK
jgi:arylsulfatase A-like enzyme